MISTRATNPSLAAAGTVMGYQAYFQSRSSGGASPPAGAPSGTDDHRLLLHRDAADQHPVGAITNLSGELAARPDTALSNLEIQGILSD